ncbi:hypothetical protein FSP39_003273 [Pinctada imbricata]|uniref:Reverse transcriptase domain-containing protein n=1 Tax=Pinctada imbricata TaxID=66713 RepID=A0AA89C330_PINIB|nr:hypothetical protein FSP39_003273 [Pinctada imbricata]
MDSFETALPCVTKGCFFASVDLSNAYYTVPLAENYKKYTRFTWEGRVFQYTCLPMGLASAPRIFTKIMKPVFATLRKLGHVIIGYIDDSLIIGNSVTECSKAVNKTIECVESLGFYVNYKKSSLIPSNRVTFLGNVIDSNNMTVTLTESRAQTLHDACLKLFNKQIASIREVTQVIGFIVASFSAIQYGKLHYRALERAKIEALKINVGNYDASMDVTPPMKTELSWWIKNAKHSYRKIENNSFQFTITSDASLLGWGAYANNEKAGGRWTAIEAENHINYLELLACFLALKSFESNILHLHVRLYLDNQTAISYINNMGGIVSENCDELSKEIWNWCIKRNIWLTACYIPGVSNTVADSLSRKFDDQIEWMLNKSVFNQLINKWGKPDIDLFASRLNKQVSTFCSYRPDPEATFINAFSISWHNFYAYLNPPFSILGRCLQKIRQDEGNCLLIAPVWTTQVWFPVVMDLLIDYPLILPTIDNLLVQPDCEMQHPLKKSIVLMACRVSGSNTQREDFRKKLPLSSSLHGNLEQRSSTRHSIADGFVSVARDRVIHFLRL